MTSLVIIGFIAILASLGAALFFMMRGDQKDGKEGPRKMARALGVRVGLSILLFVTILLAWKLGYIQPTGIPGGH